MRCSYYTVISNAECIRSSLPSGRGKSNHQTSKAKQKGDLLSAIRVNPGIQSACASCQMQRRLRNDSNIYKRLQDARGDPDLLSSGSDILGMRALSNQHQSGISLLGDRNRRKGK